MWQCWKIWGYPWLAHDMTDGHYQLLLALEDLDKSDFGVVESEQEFVERFKKKMEKKREKIKEKQVKTSTVKAEKDTIKETQEKIEQQIIKNKE